MTSPTVSTLVVPCRPSARIYPTLASANAAGVLDILRSTVGPMPVALSVASPVMAALIALLLHVPVPIAPVPTMSFTVVVLLTNLRKKWLPSGSVRASPCEKPDKLLDVRALPLLRILPVPVVTSLYCPFLPSHLRCLPHTFPLLLSLSLFLCPLPLSLLLFLLPHPYLCPMPFLCWILIPLPPLRCLSPLLFRNVPPPSFSSYTASPYPFFPFFSSRGSAV